MSVIGSLLSPPNTTFPGKISLQMSGTYVSYDVSNITGTGCRKGGRIGQTEGHLSNTVWG